MEPKEFSSRDKRSVILIKGVFWAMVVAWIVLCVLVAMNTHEDFRITDHNCQSFNSGWVLCGNKEIPVQIPGVVEGNSTELRIRNALPMDIDGRTSILLKGLHQDVTVWIDGEIRGVLDNSETRPFGRHTPSAYMIVHLNETDAGKPIEIRYASVTPADAGKLNDIRIGSDVGLIFWMIDSYASDLIFAILLLYTGVVIVFLGIVMRFTGEENPNMNLVYLGTSAIFIAVWMLGEGRLRQFYYGNLSAGELVLWEALFLAPIPMMFYTSRLQERRYSRVYMTASALALIADLTMLALELFSPYDFFDLYPIGWAVIIGSGLVVLVTIIMDFRRGIHRWRLLLGILLLMGCVVMQMWRYEQSAIGIFTNNYISLGMIMFLMLMGISAISSILKQRQEQALAIKANETKTDFLANMSHEIRTPINAMLGFDEMILREESDEQIVEYATNIKKAGGNLLSLINDILDFSKVESGKMEIVNDEYRTSSMLADVINMTYMKAQDKGLSFDIFIGKDIPRVLYGDEMRVKQILTNVLNNAVKYTEKGSVSLGVSFDKLGGTQGRLRISIADTGIGIKPENIGKITEAFQRFDLQHNRSIEGAGLGMSIVSSLLKIMGGKLQVYSTYGKGSDFRIIIPQEIKDATPIGNYQNDYRKGIRKQEAYRELFTAPQAKVLFVDDNFMNLSVVKGLLKKTKIQVGIAESGAACLELTRKNKYDLIFMDHLMPDMDGVETLHRLRNETGNPNQYTMVIALTANAIKGSREYYLEEGFHEYLSKPIEGEKLEELLLKLLPKEYIIPAEESAENVLDYLEKDQGEGTEKQQTATVDSCMQELEDMLKQAHIQVAVGYRYAGNSMGQFHWMIMLFAENFEKAYQKLQGYYIKKQEDMYTIDVHALKSNAKSIGANQLYQLAWEHEQQSRAGNWNYVREHWDELSREWLCVVNGILNYIGENPVELSEAAVTEESDEGENYELTPAQRMLLDNCISLIEDYDADSAERMLTQLLQEDLTEGIRQQLIAAEKKLEQMEYEDVLRILKCI